MNRKRELAKKVLAVRLRYLRKHTKKLPYASASLSFAIVVLAIVKWLIIVPYFDKLFYLASIGDFEKIKYELEHMPVLLKYSPFLIAADMLILSVSLGLLAYIFHRVSKIRYISYLVMGRHLRFFSTIMCALSTILWANLARAFIQGNTETIMELIGPIWFSEKMFRLGFSAASILLAFTFYKLRDILHDLCGIDRRILVVMLLLNIVSIYDIIFALPFYVYFCIIRRRSILSFAYIDIIKYVF